jgi:small redox-active disulfide protein 2
MAHSSHKETTIKKIQILGTGCPKCKQLSENAEAAAKALGLEYELVKVTDINEIMKYGIIMTPGLAVDGEVKSVGKVLPIDEIKKVLA